MFRLFYIKVTTMDLLVSQLQRGLEGSGNLLVCGLQILARQAYLLPKFHIVVISLAVHFHSFYIDYVALPLFPHQSCLTYSRLSGAMPWSDPLGKGCLFQHKTTPSGIPTVIDRWVFTAFLFLLA